MENENRDLMRGVTARNDVPFNEYLESLLISNGEKNGKDPSILPHNQEALLSNIGRFPCLDRKQRQQMLGWNAQTMQNAIDALSGDYITPVKTKKGGRGSSYTTFELTEKAKKYMLTRQIHFVKLHGGVEHHCAIERWMHEKQQDGYRVVREPKIGNSIIDALAEGELKIALEVVASDNVKRDREKFLDLLSHVDQLEVWCQSQKLTSLYEKQLKKRLSGQSIGELVIRTI